MAASAQPFPRRDPTNPREAKTELVRARSPLQVSRQADGTRHGARTASTARRKQASRQVPRKRTRLRLTSRQQGDRRVSAFVRPVAVIGPAAASWPHPQGSPFAHSVSPARASMQVGRITPQRVRIEGNAHRRAQPWSSQLPASRIRPPVAARWVPSPSRHGRLGQTVCSDAPRGISVVRPQGITPFSTRATCEVVGRVHSRCGRPHAGGCRAPDQSTLLDRLSFGVLWSVYAWAVLLARVLADKRTRLVPHTSLVCSRSHTVSTLM
jgi:hypothetical protein